MAVVIDEMESTVDSGGTRAPSGGEAGEQKSGGAKSIQREQIETELHRVAVRRERLKAD